MQLARSSDAMLPCTAMALPPAAFCRLGAVKVILSRKLYFKLFACEEGLLYTGPSFSFGEHLHFRLKSDVLGGLKGGGGLG